MPMDRDQRTRPCEPVLSIASPTGLCTPPAPPHTRSSSIPLPPWNALLTRLSSRYQPLPQSHECHQHLAAFFH
ncbi:unnamed protein product [Urochloa humidicola]